MVLTHLVFFSFLNGASLPGVAATPDSPHYTPILGPADWRSIDDQTFEANARVATLAEDLEDLVRFIDEVEAAGDEFVDPWESGFGLDHDLFGTKRRGRR